MMFWVGLFIGIIIKTIHSKVLSDRERIEWVQQCIGMLTTRLNRLRYLFGNMDNMEYTSVCEQLLEAVDEFSDTLIDLTEGMREML